MARYNPDQPMDDFARGQGKVRVIYEWYDTRGNRAYRTDEFDVQPGETVEMFLLRIEELQIENIGTKHSAEAFGDVRIGDTEILPNLPLV
jgi:hypothetical protein